MNTEKADNRCGKSGCNKEPRWQGYVGCLKVLACDEHNHEIEGVVGGVGGVPWQKQKVSG